VSVFGRFADEATGEVDTDAMLLDVRSSELSPAAWKKSFKQEMPTQIRAMQRYLQEVEEDKGPRESYENVSPISLECIAAIFAPNFKDA